jgi:IS4 transposase
LRLVVTEVRDLGGRVLARWLLLTNVPTELADAATIARWYYFRWRIENSQSQSPSRRSLSRAA